MFNQNILGFAMFSTQPKRINSFSGKQDVQQFLGIWATTMQYKINLVTIHNSEFKEIRGFTVSLLQFNGIIRI